MYARPVRSIIKGVQMSGKVKTTKTARELCWVNVGSLNLTAHSHETQ